MKSHFSMNQGVAMACAVSGAATMMTKVASAQSLVAADYATNSTYASGWAEGANGGFGFGPWSMYGTYTSPIQHAMDNTSPYNPFGQAWTLFLPEGKAVGCPNDPDGGDLSRAGRSCAPLQVGQTVTTVFANPTERHFYNGYSFRLVSGTNNVTYSGTAIERFALYRFEYFNYGLWYSTAGATSLYDTDTAAGMRLAVTLTGPNSYRFVMTPLANPSNAYTNFGALTGSGPVNWIQFETYNTDSDFFPQLASGCQTNTDFYISSLTISDVQPISPQFVTQPASLVLYPGRSARFTGSSLGTALSYQWRKNGAALSNGGNISGALTDTLVINNVGPGDLAGYTLIVTNSAGAITSSPPATLTLVQPSATPYETAVLDAGPIAHWRLNEMANPATNPPAYDYIGGLAGSYGNASSNAFNAIHGPLPSDGFPAFENNNGAMKCSANTAQSWVTVPPLNINTDTLTMTAWIYPNGDQAEFCGLFYSRRNGIGHGMSYGGSGSGTAGMLAYAWNYNSQNTWGFFSGLSIPANQWSLVAVAIEPAKATLYLYNSSGFSSATNEIPHTAEAWDGDSLIGSDPNSAGRTFDGRIDEVAVFDHTLTAPQLQALYYGLALNIQHSGSNIILSWPQGTLLEATSLAGPWATNNASSPYITTPAGSQKFYRLVR